MARLNKRSRFYSEEYGWWCAPGWWRATRFFWTPLDGKTGNTYGLFPRH